jgi:SAM-dependent methyltransferase
MENHLDKTIQTYKDSFEKYVETTPGELNEEMKRFNDAFLFNIPKGGDIVEIGSAHGRDARYFEENGYNVLCTDVMEDALDELEEDGFAVAEYDFRDTPVEEWQERFDGVFASAVLLHANDEQLGPALKNLTSMAKPGGTIAFSLKKGEGEEVSNEKLNSPRYFNYHQEEDIAEVLDQLPFGDIDISESNNEGGPNWLYVVAKKKVNHE